MCKRELVEKIKNVKIGANDHEKQNCKENRTCIANSELHSESFFQSLYPLARMNSRVPKTFQKKNSQVFQMYLKRREHQHLLLGAVDLFREQLPLGLLVDHVYSDRVGLRVQIVEGIEFEL